MENWCVRMILSPGHGPHPAAGRIQGVSALNWILLIIDLSNIPARKPMQTYANLYYLLTSWVHGICCRCRFFILLTLEIYFKDDVQCRWIPETSQPRVMIFQLQLAHPELQHWRFYKFGKFVFANGTISRCINISEEHLHLVEIQWRSSSPRNAQRLMPKMQSKYLIGNIKLSKEVLKNMHLTLTCGQFMAVFRFETSAPGLPGFTCIMSFRVVPSYSFILIYLLVLLWGTDPWRFSG